MRKLGERVLGACAELCTGRPWLVLSVAALLTLLAGWYSTHLTVTTETDAMLAQSLPFKKVERDYRAAFPRRELVLAIVDGPTPAAADSAADNLAYRLRARPDLFQNVDVPGSSRFFTDNGILFLEQEPLRNLTAQLAQAKPLLTLFARDPSLRGIASLVSNPDAAGGRDAAFAARLFGELGETAAAKANNEDRTADWVKIMGFERPGGRPGTRRFVTAKPVLDTDSIDRAPALEMLDQEIAGVVGEEAGGVKIQVTGEPALRQQELDDAFSGALTASILSFILVALSLILGIRSGRLILILLVTLIVGGIWTTGLATLFVGSLNLISIAFMVLFFGLGVDFGTHLGLRFLEARKKGLAFAAALKEAMLEEAPSIGLSTVCAAVAFLSFVPTSYTGLAEFGIISALGMLVAFTVTFTVQPALMAVLPPSVPRWGNFNIGIGGFIKRFHMPIVVLAGLVTIAAAFFAVNARIDVNPLNLQDPNAPPVVAYRDLAKTPATSPYSLNVVAANAEEARARAEKLAAIPGVERVASAEDFLPKEQDEKLRLIAQARTALGPEFFNAGGALPPPDDAQLRQAFAALRVSAERIAGNAPAGSELRTGAEKLRDGLAAFADRRGADGDALKDLDQAMVGSLPDIVAGIRQRLSVDSPLTIANLPPEIRADWIAADGRIRLQVTPAQDIGSPEGLEDFAQKVQAVEPSASGVPVSVTEAGYAILHAFGEAILYTVIAIAVIVAFLRRRLSDVLLILTPLAVAAIWTAAASALLDLPFNFANVIVIPLLIGLGVAGSVHIVVRARELSEQHAGGTGQEGDVLDTSTSLAVLVAQLNTVAAFATLAISHHRGLYSMGLLLGLAILLVLIVCLVVLPASMIALQRLRKPATLTAEKPPAREGQRAHIARTEGAGR